MNEDIYIVIPAKNEGKRIGKVIQQTLDLGYPNIVVINDGSDDDTEEVALSYGVTVLNHSINLGPGAATQTGIEYATQMGANILVTMDADRQHIPGDINILCDEMRAANVDVVIGSRFLHTDNDIPFIRVLYNKVGNMITYVLTGIAVSDSQSGMKAFKSDFARKSKLRFNGYEFCIEFIKNIRLNKASYSEVPIRVIYTKDTMEKGQSFISGVKMIGKLLKLF